MKRNLELAALIIGLVTAVCSAVGSFYLLPYRVAKVEEAQARYEKARNDDHELLVRIDERTADIRRALESRKLYEIGKN